MLLNFIAAPTTAEAVAWAEFPHSGEQIERHRKVSRPHWHFGKRSRWCETRASSGGLVGRGLHARQPNAVLALYLQGKKFKQYLRTANEVVTYHCLVFPFSGGMAAGAPDEVRQLPRLHPASWQRVLLEALERLHPELRPRRGAAQTIRARFFLHPA